MTHILASLQSLTYSQEKNPGLPGLKNRYVFMFEGQVQDSRFKIQVGGRIAFASFCPIAGAKDRIQVMANDKRISANGFLCFSFILFESRMDW